MPKGRSYEYSGGHRAGQKSGHGYPGRGAAGKARKSTSLQPTNMAKEGTLAGANTQVMHSNEMRGDMTSGIQHANPFPGNRGGNYTGPGRS